MHFCRWILLILICLLLQGCMSTRMTEQMQLGRLKFSEGKYKQAFRDLLPVAVYGKAPAEYAVGYMYYYGYGVARDPECGLFWMTKAAERNYLPAIIALDLIRRGPQPCLTKEATEINEVPFKKSFKDEMLYKEKDEVLKGIVTKKTEIENDDLAGPFVENTQSPDKIAASILENHPELVANSTLPIQQPTHSIDQPVAQKSVELADNSSSAPRVQKDSDIILKQALSQPIKKRHQENDLSAMVEKQRAVAEEKNPRIFQKRAVAEEEKQPRLIQKPQVADNANLPLLKTEMKPTFEKTQSSVQKNSAPAVAAMTSHNSEIYGLQVFGAFQLEHVKNLQRDLQLEKSTHIWLTKHQGKDWYVLTHGNYASVEEARRARDKLAVDIKDLDPWVRKLDGLKAVG